MHPVVRAMLQANVVKGKAYYDGNGDYITLADSEDWSFGNGNLEIEFAITQANISTTKMIISQYSTGNYWYLEYQPSNSRFYFLSAVSGSNVANYYFSVTPQLAVEKTYKLTRVGTSLTLTEDDTPLSATVNTAIGTSNLTNSTSALYIGAYAYDGSESINAYMDSFKITKGITVVLDLKFAEEIGATTFIDGTGKTVTTHGDVVIVE